MQPHELFLNVSPIITRDRAIFINCVEYFAMLLYKEESTYGSSFAWYYKTDTDRHQVNINLYICLERW